MQPAAPAPCPCTCHLVWLCQQPLSTQTPGIRHTLISEECAPADSCGQGLRDGTTAGTMPPHKSEHPSEPQDWALALHAPRHLILPPNTSLPGYTQIVMLVHNTFPALTARKKFLRGCAKQRLELLKTDKTNRI